MECLYKSNFNFNYNTAKTEIMHPAAKIAAETKAPDHSITSEFMLPPSLTASMLRFGYRSLVAELRVQLEEECCSSLIQQIL